MRRDRALGSRTKLITKAAVALAIATALPVALGAPAHAAGPVVANTPFGPLAHLTTVTSANGIPFSSPSGVGYDEQGNVLVADTGNNRVVKLSPTGAHIPTPELDGGSGGFSAPYGVSNALMKLPDATGAIFVADTGNDRIRRYHATTGWTDVDAGTLNAPKGVVAAETTDGPVHSLVGDTGNHRIRFSTFGDGWSDISGTTFAPTGVSWYLRFDQFGEGHRFIETAADPVNHRVVQYRTGGSAPVFEKTYGGPGTAVGKLWKPEGVSTENGFVWIADTGNNRIQLFQESTNNVLAVFGGLGTAAGKFNKPRGIAVSRNRGVAVADTGNNRVQLFGTPPGQPLGWNARSFASGAITVRWTPPLGDGASPITSYVVESPQTPQTCTWTSGPLECTFTGLTNEQPYTFTIRAVNDVGSSGTAPPSNLPPLTATPHAVPPSLYHTLKPVKVFDTTTGTGGAPADIGPGASAPVTVAGVGGVPPTGATAVLVELTTTAPTAVTSLTAWPTGEAQPSAANVQARAGETRTNLAVVRLGTGGTFTIANAAGSTDARVDVLGWFDGGDDISGRVLEPTTPEAVQNSRSYPWRLRNGYIRKMALPSSTWYPGTIILDITLHGAPQDSAVKAWIEGSHLDAVVVAHAQAGESTTSRVVLNKPSTQQPGSPAYLYLYNTKPGEVPATVEVVGIASSPSPSTKAFHTGTPERVLDTETGTGGPATPFGTETRTVQVAGAGSVPAGVTSAVVNVTARNPSAAAALTVWATGTAQPPANLLAPAAGASTDALRVVKLGPAGTVNVANSGGTTDVTMDVVSWILP